MVTIDLLLLLLAFFCFVAAALNVPTRGVNLIAVGLAFWVLSVIV